MKSWPSTLAALIVASTPLVAEQHSAEGGEPGEAAELTAQTVVATVNGTDITLGEMIVMRSQLPQRYSALAPEVLFDGILEQLVNQQLLSETLDEVPDRVDYALANEERSLKAGEVVVALTATAVTEDAIEEAYEARFEGQETGTEYNASHILVESEQEALDLIQQIENGADFALLARQNSTGPSGPNGGQLGWFGEGQMVPAFEAAVLALEIGEVSPPVETQFGWHVVTLNDKRDQERPSLDQLRPEIEAMLQEEAIDNRIGELSEVADIDVVEPGTIDPTVLLDLELLEP